jgi:hypothetical protein
MPCCGQDNPSPGELPSTGNYEVVYERDGEQFVERYGSYIPAARRSAEVGGMVRDAN